RRSNDRGNHLQHLCPPSPVPISWTPLFAGGHPSAIGGRQHVTSVTRPAKCLSALPCGPQGGGLDPPPCRPPAPTPGRSVRRPTALYAGSFDPVTNGHLDVIRQAARLVDRLVLALGIHPGKAPLFSAEERIAMLGEACGPVAKAAGCELKTVTFADLVVMAARR